MDRTANMMTALTGAPLEMQRAIMAVMKSTDKTQPAPAASNQCSITIQTLAETAPRMRTSNARNPAASVLGGANNVAAQQTQPTQQQQPAQHQQPRLPQSSLRYYYYSQTPYEYYNYSAPPLKHSYYF